MHPVIPEVNSICGSTSGFVSSNISFYAGSLYNHHSTGKFPYSVITAGLRCLQQKRYLSQFRPWLYKKSTGQARCFVPQGSEVSGMESGTVIYQRDGTSVAHCPDSGKLCSLMEWGQKLPFSLSVNEMKNLLIRGAIKMIFFFFFGNGDMELWTFIRCFVRFPQLKNFLVNP